MYFLCISKYISLAIYRTEKYVLQFQCPKILKIGIITGIHLETVYLFKHFLLYIFRV